MTSFSIACDNCRQVRRKCESDIPGGPCRACLAASIDCHFTQPSRQRGPPKGYLRAVESRLHEMEATLGLIQSIPDESVQSLLQDIAQDPYARHILDRVRQSPFGPDGQPPMSAGVEPSTSSSFGRGQEPEAVNPFVEGPTNEWQRQVVAHLMARQSLGWSSAAPSQQTNAVPTGLPTSRAWAAGPSRSTESQQYTPQVQRNSRPIAMSSFQGHRMSFLRSQ
ncbi:hypothetical protein SISNIDRAFT_158783 [Sistotremastrum niveocremeum HHB9708]|uniref:Zn(2)-C6 fungal-type domain-containing protein n=1 Tax=Sistotremastrum niveocremeum HHB9708 TaxID=1314777 RepID=A0A164SSM5_9AGAM|nr:hypothetical protein SISNIDRAFT_158783 [Sistotremastrum niveocremeum HHB9708]